MALQNKTFVVTVPIIFDAQKFELGVAQGNEQLDAKVNEFVAQKHWSQIRDIFQHEPIVLANAPSVTLARTIVFTSEQLASRGAATPSVGPVA